MLAELNMGSHTEETASSSNDDDGSATLALVLGAVGAGLGAIALVISLARRRAWRAGAPVARPRATAVLEPAGPRPVSRDELSVRSG